MGTAYLAAGVVAPAARPPEAWAEAGWHATRELSLFGRGWASPSEAGAMLGARIRF